VSVFLAFALALPTITRAGYNHTKAEITTDSLGLIRPAHSVSSHHGAHRKEDIVLHRGREPNDRATL
jgi:hypothetical protein